MKSRILLVLFCLAIVFGLPSFRHSGVQAQSTSHGIQLTWTAGVPTTGQVADSSYNVYRSTTTGGPYTQINSAAVTVTTYLDSTVTGGVKYFYVVTGLATGGTESTFSNEASATFLPQAATPGGLVAAGK